MTLLYYDIRDYPACDAGTVVDGPDSEGYYGILDCVEGTPSSFNSSSSSSSTDDYDGGSYSLDDDLTRSELYDDALSASRASDPVTCTTTRSQRPCDMGAILVCEGGIDSPYLLTVVCSALWAAAQLYLAVPIMLGGIRTFNLLGLFNAFCLSAIPLLVRPLAVSECADDS